jgi:hypothetical protein
MAQSPIDGAPLAGEPGDDAGPPESPKRKVIGKPFEPGRSANPGGRPKTDARLKLTLGKLSLAAVRELGRLLRDPTTSKRTRAQISIYLIDRKLGRPTQAIAGADGQPLLPGGPAENPLAHILERLRVREAAASAGEAAEPVEPANAPPGANGGEPRRPS